MFMLSKMSPLRNPSPNGVPSGDDCLPAGKQVNNIGICSGPKDSFGDEQVGDIAPKHNRKTQ